MITAHDLARMKAELREDVQHIKRLDFGPPCPSDQCFKAPLFPVKQLAKPRRPIHPEDDYYDEDQPDSSDTLSNAR